MPVAIERTTGVDQDFKTGYLFAKWATRETKSRAEAHALVKRLMHQNDRLFALVMGVSEDTRISELLGQVDNADRIATRTQATPRESLNAESVLFWSFRVSTAGIYLGAATRAQLDAEIAHLRKRSTRLRGDARWLELIAESLPDKTPVEDFYTDAQLAELLEQAKRETAE